MREISDMKSAHSTSNLTLFSEDTNSDLSIPSRDDLEQVINLETQGMGILREYFLNRERKKVEFDHVRQVIESVYDARYQLIDHQINSKIEQAKLQIDYESDLAKKKIWLQYAQGLKDISHQMTKQKTEFVLQSSKDTIEAIGQIELDQKPLFDQLSDDLERNAITQDSYDRQMALLIDQRDLLWNEIRSMQENVLVALNQQFASAVTNVGYPSF